MEFILRDMTPQDALSIVDWHYPEPYAFYDMTADMEDLQEFLDVTRWTETPHIAVYNRTGALIGYFLFYLMANGRHFLPKGRQNEFLLFLLADAHLAHSAFPQIFQFFSARPGDPFTHYLEGSQPDGPNIFIAWSL